MSAPLCLTSLPEDCFRLILETLSIAEQLSIRCVCRRFQNTLQRIFEEKRSLKIFATSWDAHRQFDSITKYDLVDKPDFAVQASPGANDEVLILEGLKLSFDQLPTIFPNINRLMIYQAVEQFQDSKFFAIIKQWSALKHLSLFGLPDSLSVNFWSDLNTFEGLETLNFGFTRCTISEKIFSLLSKIQSFTLVMYSGDNIEQILVHLKSICTLNLSYVFLSSEQLQRALEQNNSLAEKLTYIGLDFINSRNSNREANFHALIQLICNWMKNLNYLDMLFGDDIPIIDLFTNLQKLTNLTSLRLHISENQIPNSFSLNQFPQLRQVKQLVLELNSDSFFDLINFIFPNLESLKLRSCTKTEPSKLRAIVKEKLICLKNLTIVKF